VFPYDTVIKFIFKEKTMKKHFVFAAVAAALLGAIAVPAAFADETITVAAAASLKNVFEEKGGLIQTFQKKNPGIKVSGTYDSSGKLQTQIEQGLDADVFFSAATKQMDALVAGNFINSADVKNLLQNKIVLIKSTRGKTAVTSFETITKAKSIAIGDPGSVPAGQYAKEALTKLGSWDAVDAISSKGTNVTEVLTAVAQGSAEVGIVYATDAASMPKQIKVIAVLADGVLEAPVIYPVAVTAKSTHPAAAKLFTDFLASPEAIKIFQKYGFAENK
jgi:molybdate transport system substrate-binding protein